MNTIELTPGHRIQRRNLEDSLHVSQVSLTHYLLYPGVSWWVIFTQTLLTSNERVSPIPDTEHMVSFTKLLLQFSGHPLVQNWHCQLWHWQPELVQMTQVKGSVSQDCLPLASCKPQASCTFDWLYIGGSHDPLQVNVLGWLTTQEDTVLTNPTYYTKDTSQMEEMRRARYGERSMEFPCPLQVFYPPSSLVCSTTQIHQILSFRIFMVHYIGMID